MLTYVNLKAHVTHALGNRYDISTYVGEWVNWAYKHCWNRATMVIHQAEDISTGNTVAAQAYLDIPSGTFAVLRVVVNYVVLDKRPWEEHARLPISTSMSTAAPSKYYVHGTKIYFDTKPASTYAYSVYRVKNLTALSADSDTPSLPDAFEAPLVSQAIAYGYRALNLPQEASYWFNSAKIDLIEALKPYQQETEDFATGIGVQFSEEVDT
ncbi:MAG: hypothetical protein ABFE07_18765 [Armatimonadia bacterium]